MFPLFGPTLATRDNILATDEIIFGDKAADPTGATGVRIPATSIVHRSSLGNYTLPWSSNYLGSTFTTEYFLGLKMDVADRSTRVISRAADATGFVGFYTGLTEVERARINSVGNFRIGTAGNINFNARLGIQSSGDQTVLELFDNGAANTCQLALSNASWLAGIASVAGNLVFQSGGLTERARIKDNGYFGIGTTNPLVPLHILRTAAAVPSTPLVLQNANDTTGASTDLDFSTHSGAVITGRIRNIINGANDYHLAFFTYLGSLQERWRMTDVGHFRPGADNNQTVGTASFRCSVIYAGTGAINTSDEREKSDIGPIPDEWLDAWGDVEWSRFKMTGGRRWHVGLVAQRVHAAFAARDLNAFDIGLCCFDAWDEQTQPVYEKVTRIEKVEVPSGEVYKSGKREGEPKMRLVDQEVEETVETGLTEIVLEAGDRWGLRYDECQAIEAAWQRREISKLKDQIALLIAGSSQAG